MIIFKQHSAVFQKIEKPCEYVSKRFEFFFAAKFSFSQTAFEIWSLALKASVSAVNEKAPSAK